MTGTWFFKLYSPRTASSNYNITRIMFYYRIFVNELSYKSSEALTYAFEENIAVGSIVQVPLRSKTALGFVIAKSAMPNFKTKNVISAPPFQPLPSQLVKLAQWLLLFYPSSIGVVTKMLLPRSLRLTQQTDYSESTVSEKKLPTLTYEQKVVLDAMKIKPETYILHGETGSGKTRVYVELAKKVLAKNKSSLILTPEIGLTPQLFATFEAVFGDERIVILHSNLPNKTRSLAWQKILNSKRPLVIIGPRSALFSPITNLGLIVVDEAHEPSYKQEQMPHYLTTRVASKLVALHKATLVLGSATPSITDYYFAVQKEKPILRMSKAARAKNTKEETLTAVIDIKKRNYFKRSSYLSDRLIEEISRALELHEQSMLFLNRRGTARLVLCNNCGWQAVCPNCNLPLTYHADSHTARCHTCGFKQQLKTSCPVCENTEIILKSIGTKYIVDEITSIFPNARVRRFDADNSKEERLEQNYNDLRSGKIDILVGTQILSKGLDLPKLSVVGVVNADTSLCFPDYTAGERTYQLLRQVIGRVGRGHNAKSTIIIQTYDPENEILKAAIISNWDEFYTSQINERKKFKFPPFCFLLKLTCRRASVSAAAKSANTLAQKISQSSPQVIVDGPSPSFQEKVGKKFQWQLVIKAADRSELLKIINGLPSGWSYDIDPLNLL